jgi:hypothetical protein
LPEHCQPDWQRHCPDSASLNPDNKFKTPAFQQKGRGLLFKNISVHNFDFALGFWGAIRYINAHVKR